MPSKRQVLDQLKRDELIAAVERQVKKTARDLLKSLKGSKLVLDWRKRQQSRAQVRVTIEQVMDEGLPETYTTELFEAKCARVYQHVFDAYYGPGASIYETTA